MNLKEQHTPLNILHADDDTDDRTFFASALKEIPIETSLTTVIDGEQLMSYLSENSKNLPDILFLDLSMPRKTGFECLTEIKEDEKLKNIPVIVFTTSFGRSLDFEKSMIKTLSGIGAMEYIRKPSNNEELKVIIHKALLLVIKKGSTNDKT